MWRHAVARPLLRLLERSVLNRLPLPMLTRLSRPLLLVLLVKRKHVRAKPHPLVVGVPAIVTVVVAAETSVEVTVVVAAEAEAAPNPRGGATAGHSGRSEARKYGHR